MEAVAVNPTSKVVNFFKALDAKDIEAVKSFWSKDHLMHYPSGSAGINAEMHTGMSGMFMSAFPDFSHEIEDIIEAGNKVIARGYFSGTHKGDFNGIPATGKLVRVSWINIYEYDDAGKVKEEWLELDSVGMMQQMGVIPS